MATVLKHRLNRMSLNVRTALSEQGVNVLFVAFGFLKWFEAEHSEEPRLSPLLLVPVCLERMGAQSWYASATWVPRSRSPRRGRAEEEETWKTRQSPEKSAAMSKTP